jgi:hypothetical protein
MNRRRTLITVGALSVAGAIAAPAWKLTNEAKWIRFKLKYRNGECCG